MKGFIALLFIFVSLFPSEVSALPIQFADSVEVSLLTCEPGDAVYAKFGHTALRIRDAAGRDMSYNYGIFDFRTEHFYLKFLRGHTDYLLGVYPTEYFLEEYRQRESMVWEQVLNLSTAEKQQLIELLNVNYQPENRMYRYNFVFDNCATRPKVMVQNALDGMISYSSAYSTETYRQLINLYISDDAWLHLGINLIFGAAAEQEAGQSGASFLPLLLRNDLQRAVVVGPPTEADSRKLVSHSQLVVGPFSKEVKTTAWWLHPLFLFLIIVVWGSILTFRKNTSKVLSNCFDSALYLVTSLAGMLIFTLSFFSEHPLVESNWNILWLNPLNLLPAVLIWYRGADKLLLVYHTVNLLLILIAVVVIAFQVQVIPVAAIPVLIVVLIRTSRRFDDLLKRYYKPGTTGWKWKR